MRRIACTRLIVYCPLLLKGLIGVGLVAAVAPTGCGSAAGGASDAGNENADNENDTVGPLEGLEDGWNEIFPGGDTICSRGTPFSFFVHPGTVNKVVVDFMGGGACWDADSCSEDSSLFVDAVDPFRDMLDGDDVFGMGKLDGIYNRTNEDNPFKDWHHVIIPYCSGDVHWGDASQDFGDFHIEFRGAVNTRAVLDWLYDNIEAPEQVFVTGCSAGSVGSALWFAHIAEHYSESKVTQFGDSFAGIITEEFFDTGFPLWNAEAIYPDWIADYDPQIMADFYIAIANHYPALFMSQFNSTGDGAQPMYYTAMGGTGEWATEMLESLDTIEAGADNFAAFVSNGNYHCVVTREQFYTISAGGTSLLEWINALLSDGRAKNVRD